MESNLTLALVLVATLGIATQWLAWRFHQPAIVLLLVAGLLVGPVLGWLHPSQDFGNLLHPIIRLGVAIILFEGGLNLRLHELREAATGVKRLVSVGVVLSWGLGSAAAHLIGGLSWPVALVFGAITVVTGPTVIMPMLRQARLNRRPASYLKWEGIINDPVGALLAVVVFQYFISTEANAGFSRVMAGLAVALVAAALLGVGTGQLLGAAFRRGYVPEFLKGPVLFAAVLLIYIVANLVQNEAGLMAATVFGISMGNQRLAAINEIRRYKEYMTVLLVSGVFIILTADLDPGVLAQLDWRSGALLAALVFLVRPTVVLLATWGAGMSWQERALVAWIAPRGIVAAAVAAVFAPEMVAHGYADASVLVPLVFSLILITVVLHGLSIHRLALWLGLASTRRNGILIVGASPWTVELARVLQDLKVPVLIVDQSWDRLKPARLSGLRVSFGEILSESSEESLELNDIGYLLASSYNDAYNALVCTRFAPELGRNRVFQLRLHARDEDDPRALVHTMRGQVVFDEQATYDELMRRHYQGWRFQKTRLTEAYGYEDFRRDCPADALHMVVVRDNGDVVFQSPKTPVKPRTGDAVVCFLKEPEPLQLRPDTGLPGKLPADPKVAES
ncbi:MAG: sodium:proton exchanger [Chromatiales bacterium 21-64-14]|nr:MAG: sodium:proton exchanger [Chromatiales bacterium 21-64-14]HQU17120.1 sodium:proton antiporter [Gammaproteobacteria bacterium]